jgi:hypothetical protein
MYDHPNRYQSRELTVGQEEFTHGLTIAPFIRDWAL